MGPPIEKTNNDKEVAGRSKRFKSFLKRETERNGVSDVSGQTWMEVSVDEVVGEDHFEEEVDSFLRQFRPLVLGHVVELRTAEKLTHVRPSLVRLDYHVCKLEVRTQTEIFHFGLGIKMYFQAVLSCPLRQFISFREN